MTPAERDKLLERLADGMIDHAEASVGNHADLRIRLSEIQTTISQIRGQSILAGQVRIGGSSETHTPAMETP